MFNSKPPGLTKSQPLVPEGIELSVVQRPVGTCVEVKRTSDGMSAFVSQDCTVRELHRVAWFIATDNLLTLFLNNVALYKNGERLRSVTSGNWTACR